MAEIRVPELGESIVEATVLSWLKELGDEVTAGDAVLELETDKVNVEVIAESGGVLERIDAQAGQTVQVGEVIAVIGEAAAKTATGTPDPGQEATHNQNKRASSAQEIPQAQKLPEKEASSAPRHAPKVLAQRSTPAVRRLAHERGVDLSAVAGSGGLTRVTEADVLANTVGNRGAHQVRGEQASDNQSTEGAMESDHQEETRERMSRRRMTIAKRLVEAQHNAAMLTTFNEVDMSRILELRERRKEKFREEHGVSLGFMSFFTKAAVAALKAFPHLNAEIQGEEVVLKRHYDIGIAVSTEAGLVVPVVRDADRLSFAEIEQEIARLASMARDSKLRLTDLQGGTFTITNGGVFGSLFSTPILNAPQVGILGMHGITQRPVAVDGEVVSRPMMYIALSYDHRIVDGSEAVRFLVTVKRLTEDPEQLLLEG